MTIETVLRPKGHQMTAAWLATVRIPEGCARVTIKDTHVPGLELRMSASGNRSWAVSKRLNGAQRRFTIPHSAGMTLAEARAAARVLIVDLQRGRDPIAEKKASKLEKDQAAQLAKLGLGVAKTLREVITEYEKRVIHPAQVRGEHKGWDKSKRVLNREYGVLFDLPLTEVTDGRLLQIADAAVERNAPTSGWHGIRGLRTILRWAVGRRLIESAPTETMPLKDLARTMKGGTRDRVLQPEEIARLWRVWEAAPADPYSGMFRLMLLTGQRRGEVSGIKWGDVDFERREWKQTANKSSRAHSVPLCAMALEIIAAQPKRRAEVFTSSRGSPVSGVKGNWSVATLKYSAASGVLGWHRHDLRRTAATLMASLRVDKGIIEMLLNHATTAGRGGLVASIYNRHSYDIEKREATEKLAAHIRDLADKGTGAVLPFPQIDQQASGQ